MNFVAITSMKLQVRSYVAARRVDEEVIATEARKGNLLGEAIHRWIAARETALTRTYETREMLDFWSPVALAWLYPMSPLPGGKLGRLSQSC